MFDKCFNLPKEMAQFRNNLSLATINEHSGRKEFGVFPTIKEADLFRGGEK